MVPLVLHFTTQGTWDLAKQRNDGGWSGGFFMAQAESMLRGRLDVAPEEVQAECFQRRRRCYGYFGLTPSLVRIPVLPILRAWQTAATPLFIGIAVLLGYWSALQLVRRALAAGDGGSRREAMTYAVIAALALGPGGALLFVVRPAVFEEAAAWGVAFFLLTANHTWAWCARAARSLIPAVLLGTAAASARPTAATACGVLGLFAVAWCWRRGRPRRELVAAWCLCLLPGLTASSVFWLKLRTLVPSVALNTQVQEAPHWKDILERNGGRTAGPIFVPTALVAYFRPDTLLLRSEWPYLDFRFPAEPIQWVPPLPKDGAYVERVASLTATMPWPCLVTVLVSAALVFNVRARRAQAEADGDQGGTDLAEEDQRFLAAGLLTSAAAMGVLTLTTVGITNRYLADFYPLTAIGVALGARFLVPWWAQHPRAGAVAGAASILVSLGSAIVVLSLATRLVFE
jgi:hypothetical protein